MKHKVTKQYRTETGHRLMDYDGLCAHNHGHSYLWEVTATTDELSEKGMVVDFKDLKAAMEHVLKPFDHASVYRHDDPIADYMLAVPSTNMDMQRVMVFEWNPTAENFSKYAFEQIQRYLGQERADGAVSIYVVNVRVWETATSFADYGVSS